MNLALLLIVLGVAVALLTHSGLGLLMIFVGLLVLLLPYARTHG